MKYSRMAMTGNGGKILLYIPAVSYLIHMFSTRFYYKIMIKKHEGFIGCFNTVNINIEKSETL